ncbi:MAG TPA: penicillin-binding protein 2 [Dehalococcoidia bacterium]|nr:penicillin-binding protein 2 [Dehalococcoidia bacterium]
MGILAGSRRRRWRSEQPETDDPRAELNTKLWLFRASIVVAFVVLAIQLGRLQLVRGDEYRQRAELNQLRVEAVVPPRGLIYDRNGVQLVENVPGFSAAIIAADVPEGRDADIASGIERLLGVPALETELRIKAQRASNDPFAPIIVKDGLDQEAAFRLREQLAGLPGVQVRVEPVRQYPLGPELAHILGFTGRVDEAEYAALKDDGYLASDRIGKAGVEAAYEEYLRGEPGTREIERDASGREVRTLGEREAQPGYDLVLSIDADLQRKVTELTAAAAKGEQAAAIVLDVHTGEVLALVSLPLYDNNIFSGKVDEARLQQYMQDPKKPMVNHALAEQYPPGSIFKQITGAAALQEGVASPSTTITSRGAITVPNQYDPSIVYTFRDWSVLGTLDFYGGIAMSSDVYFYYLAGGYHEYGENFDGLGVERLAQYARNFGLGRKTGIDIAGEAEGVIPDPAWKEATFGDVWTLGDTYNMGIGQGFVATTPIQMARVVAAVANGGALLTPRVVREVRDAEGHIIVPNEPKIEGHVGVSAENLAIVREAMRQAVVWGTAKDGGTSVVQVAGKTGTAEFGQQSADGTYALTHAWYSGFAPANDPQIAVTVFLERGVGATNAGPLASRIFEYYFTRQQQRVDAAAGAPSGIVAEAAE